jgi:hypothetical protein
MTDYDSINYMLKNSPGLFGPGEFKIAFFEYFMNNNVGISLGQSWEIRRKFNEVILGHGHPIHDNNLFLQSVYNILDDECKQLISSSASGGLTNNSSASGGLKNNSSAKSNNCIDLASIGKFSRNVTSRIIFGTKDDSVYNIFKDSSLLSILAFPRVGHQDKTILHYINNPGEEYCMMNLLKEYSDKNPEIDMYAQIPHWIFPTNGSLSILLLKLIYFIVCHEPSFKNTQQLFSEPFDVIKLTTHTYLEWIILECLRVNNPVVTFFREVLQENTYTHEDGSIINFNKGDQLFVITSPLIKDPQIFPEPFRFNPDRWMDRNLQKYNLMFGLGRQVCPGQDIIKLLLKISLYNLFHNNKFTVSARTVDINNVDDMINPYNISIDIK